MSCWFKSFLKGMASISIFPAPRKPLRIGGRTKSDWELVNADLKIALGNFRVIKMSPPIIKVYHERRTHNA
jgi:hypothetical protein